jgi:Co/Zn/Cd efflux system component
MSHTRAPDGRMVSDRTDGHEEPHEHGQYDGDHSHEHGHDHSDGHGHSHGEHGHSHGLVDRSILRSREGLKAVGWSLAILGLAAVAQLLIFVLTNSVALLADLIHNFGDALTAVPLAIAFYLRSFRGEKIAGLFVVFAIFVSACVALYETIMRFIHPQQLTHLWVLAAAGLIGFIGNEIAAQVRLRAGRRLASPALIADGNHARIDGFVSLAVIASSIAVALGFDRGDPVIGLVITFVILKITWDSWRTVSTTEPGEMHGDCPAPGVPAQLVPTDVLVWNARVDDNDWGPGPDGASRRSTIADLR